MRNQNPTLREAREVLLKHVPDLDLKSLRVHDLAWDCWVFEANRKMIYRIPRRGQNRYWMERSLRYYPFLERLVPLPIPHISTITRAHSGRLLFVGYMKLSGRALPLHGLDRPPARTWARQLASMFKALDRVGAKQAKAVGITEHSVPDRWQDWKRRISIVLRSLRPYMDKNEYLEDRDYYDSALADPSFFPQGTTLCHADLFPRHILVGPGETGITGVLDWEDACLTDPATNLALLPTDAGFAQSILDAWRPGDDGLWRRSRVMAHLDFGEMVRDMIEVGKQVLDPGLLHRYHTTRRCDGR